MRIRRDTVLVGLLAGLVASGCATQRSDQARSELLSSTNAVPGSAYDLTVYVIAKGDTLVRIAKQFGTAVKDLLSLNPELDRTHLRIGQMIRVRQKRRE